MSGTRTGLVTRRTAPLADAPAVRTGRVGIAISAVVVLLVAITAGVSAGAADISFTDVVASVLSHVGIGETPLPPAKDAIVWQLRMPRVLTGAAVGAGLGLCGAIVQAVTRNALADPYLLGLSSGASLGAAVVILLGAAIALPVAAVLGASLALLTTIGLAGLAGRGTGSTNRTILAGIAVSSLFAAGTSLLVFWSATGDTYREILGWLLGTLGGANWTTTVTAAVAFVVVGLPLCAGATTLDAFAFGETAARGLGVNVSAVRWVLLGGCALLTGALVSISGSIGFVGLVVPHAVRLLVGNGHRAVLPLSALFGSIMIVVADATARTAFAPRELPVGVLTALVGAPVFAILLVRSRRRA